MVSQVEGAWTVEDWSPDGAELLAVQAVGGAELLWRISVKSGEKIALTPAGATPEIWRWPQYTPDGRSIVAASNRGSELPRVWRRDLATDNWKALTRDGDPVESMALSPDGRTLAVVFDRDAASQLDLIDVATLKVRAAPQLPAGQIESRVEWNASGSEVAFTFWSLRTFGDVFTVNSRSGAVTRWTTSELGGFNPESLPEPEIVRWKSFDGRTISGVLYRPPARFTGRRPVMISIHGGPSDTRERPRFQGRSAYFLNELGIAILLSKRPRQRRFRDNVCSARQWQEP